MDTSSRSQVSDIFAALAPSGLGVCHARLDGRLLEVNPAFCRFLGYRRDELIDRHFSELTHPDDVADNVEGVLRWLGERSPSYRTEKRYLRKDGGVVWGSVLALLTERGNGDDDSMVVFIEDISERKRLEVEKQAIEARYQTLFDNLPDSVLLTDLDTRIIGFNAEALRVYEYAPEEMLRLRVADLSVAYDESQLQGIARRLLEAGRLEVMTRHRTKSGRILDIKASLRVIEVPDGQKIFQAVYRDITAIKEIERALTKEKTNFSAILDNIPHLLWLKDVEGRFIANNAAHVKSMGRHSAEEIVGKTDFDLWPEALAKQFRADDLEVMETRKRKHLEEYVLHEGRYVWVETYKTPIIDRDGKLLGTVGFARDITERKAAEQALRQSEERLRQASRTSRTGIFDNDEVNRRIYWSPELREIYGVAADEPASFDTFVAGIHPDDRERTAEIIRRAKDPAGEGPFELEFRFVRPDGAVRWLSVRAQVIFAGEGPARRVVRSIGAVLDVTERKQSEDALRASQERLALATRAGGVGIWDWNLESRELIWDKSMFELYGIRRADFPEPTEAWRRCLHPDDIEGAEARLRESIRTKTSYDTEFRIIRPNGEVRHIKARANLLCDAHGNITRVVGTNWDMTDRKQAEEAIRESHERLQLALEASHTGTWRVDLRTGMDTRDASLNRMLGLPAVATTQPLEDWFVHLHPDDQDAMRLAWQRGLETGVYEAEHRLIRSDGRVLWVQDRGVMVRDGSGEPLYAIGAAMDVTDLKQAQEGARLAASIYQSSTEAIMVTDQRNRIIDVNPAFTRITGYALDEVIGMNPNILRSGCHDEAFYQEMWRSILNDGHWQGEIWDRRKDGELYAKWANFSVIRNPDGSIHRHIAQFSDITDKKRQDELIWTQANYDPLTNLPNRRLFQDRLEMEIRKANRSNLPLALLLIDLDRFKEINDTLGHAKGDVLLVEAARRITKCVREADTVARLGGDEFTVILPESSEKSQVERITQEIIRELSRPFALGGADCGYISATVGITLYPSDAEDIDSLMKHADQAMYRAKAEGRSRFSYFTPSMQHDAQEKRSLTDDLRQALERGELHLYYQPIVDMKARNTVKAEALLRWKHPVRGMVRPDVFIPLAEESRLIVDIGEWVFRKACSDVDRWRREFGRIVQVSVNKSPLQFEHEGGMDWLDLLSRHELPGDAITVEITEGLLLKESPRVKERLLEYQNRGIEVSIDDFGTGFSSLSYLKQFDIDYLKIDRSFVRFLTENESDKALVEAIIVMAHKLNIRTVAEGVETEEQHRLLMSFGCDFAQGFLYSPAVPATEFLALLEGR